MPNPPCVTVVVPTYNRAHVLHRAVASALAQTISDIEVLVVDDGSDDETARVVQDFSDDRIRLLRHQVRRGAPAARNTGMRAARGECIGFLDSDDEWLPVKLERQLRALDTPRQPRPEVVTCSVTHDPRHSIPVPAEPKNLSYRGLLALREGPWGGQTILVRKSPRTEVVEFDEDLPSGQDWDFLVRLARVTSVVALPEPLAIIHRAPGDRIGTLEGKLRGRLQLLQKYDEELRRFPDALAAHRAGVALASIRCRHHAQAWWYLAQAFACGPAGFRPGAHVLATFLKRYGAAALGRRVPQTA